MSDTKDFVFTLILNSANGNEVIEKYGYTTSDGRSGVIGNGDEFTLKGNQYIYISDIPDNVSYRIVETVPDGYKQTNPINLTGDILSGTTVEASAINDYTTTGHAQFQVAKSLEGRAIERYQFRFDLLDENKDLLSVAYNNADGSVRFGQQNYSNKDDGKEFTYYIVENPRGKPGYSYDDAEYTVKVVPRDNGNGTMTCSIRYFDAQGSEVTTPSFENAYSASGSIVLNAWKIFDQPLADEQFEFELLNGTGERITTAFNAADGTISFPAQNFTNEDAGETFTYYIREIPGADNTVIYDPSVFGYTVTVIDNGDGTLSFNQNYIKDATIPTNESSNTSSQTNSSLLNSGRNILSKIIPTLKLLGSPLDSSATLDESGVFGENDSVTWELYTQASSALMSG